MKKLTCLISKNQYQWLVSLSFYLAIGSRGPWGPTFQILAQLSLEPLTRYLPSEKSLKKKLFKLGLKTVVPQKYFLLQVIIIDV